MKADSCATRAFTIDPLSGSALDGQTTQNRGLQAELAQSSQQAANQLAALKQEVRGPQCGSQMTGVGAETRLLGKPSDFSGAQDAWRDWSAVFRRYAGAAAPRLQKLMTEAAKAATLDPQRHDPGRRRSGSVGAAPLGSSVLFPLRLFFRDVVGVCVYSSAQDTCNMETIDPLSGQKTPGQQMSAKFASAQMETRNPGAASIDRALSRWARAPPLDGGHRVCALESLPTCLPSNEQLSGGASQANQLYQPYSWPMDRLHCRLCPPASHQRISPPTLGPGSHWSDRGDNDIDLSDILALGAADHMFIKMARLQQPRFLRALPELLTAVAELLTRHQPHNAPVLQSARAIQQVIRAEFHILDTLGFELATPTPAAWIFRRRLSKNNNSYCCRNIGTCSQRRQRSLLTVRISLLKFMCRASLSARTPWQVNSTLLHFHRFVDLLECFFIPCYFKILVLLPQLQCS